MKNETYEPNEPTREEEIAFMKATFPEMKNSEIVNELGINKSYFYRLVGSITSAVKAA